MKRLIPALLAGFGIVSAAHADDWCRRSADRSGTVDTAGATRIVIGTGAGDLKVRGQTGQTRLEASGRACASDDDLLAQIQLETRRDGSTVYLRTVMPEIKDGSFLLNHYASLNLTVTIPDAIAVVLEDSSGDLELSKVKSASVADSSGDIEIQDIGGDLEVSDSSGDIEIERVAGNLKVQDSSGDMELEDIHGEIDIPVDSSGDIRIVQAGSVHVHNDTSGEMVIRRINGDVRVDVDSSGDIDVGEVGGNFTVGADGSGSIRHAKVVGTVQLPPR